MKRLGPVVAALLVAVALGSFIDSSAEAKPLSDEPLRLTGDITYDIRSTPGPISVTMQVRVENNDPKTTFREFGQVFFYTGVTLPLLRGASRVGASGPGGGTLSVAVDTSEPGPIIGADVTFDRNLYYGQEYSFTLSYQLEDVRSDFFLITPYYVFLPTIGAGFSSTVSITTPDGGGWEVLVEDAECSQSSPGEYQCPASEYIQVASVVEVSRPDALEDVHTSVSLAESELAITIRHFPGEEAWAAHIEELATAALPALEAIFGVPYDGPTELQIAERGRQEIYGYGGVFDCLVDCRIGISPVSDDLVAVHELAHLWTTSFSQRWLAEGLAEFAAGRAVRLLGPLASVDEVVALGDEAGLQLDDWHSVGSRLSASDDEKTLEDTGYLKSVRFFDLLEEDVGLEALQAANRAAAERGSNVDSERYLDFLEEAADAQLDALFLEWVFPPSFGATLEERRLSRDRLADLQEAVDEAGLELPSRIEAFVAAWRFENADRSMEEAETALAAYVSARDRVEDSRSLWQRIGLWRSDPESAVAAAAGAFPGGNFDEVIDRSEAAESTIDDASGVALVRLFIVVLALAAVGFLGTAGVLLWRWRRSPA